MYAEGKAAGVGVAVKTKQAASPAGWLEIGRGANEASLSLRGRWTVDTVGALEGGMAAPDLGKPARVVLDLSGLTALDTAGAWVVLRTEAALRKTGAAVTVAGASPAHGSLLETVARQHVSPPPRPAHLNPLVAVVAAVGAATIRFGQNARDLLNFLGLTVITGARTFIRPGQVPAAALANQMEQAGLDAMPIVGLLSFLIGVVTAYQGADQLARFGAQIFTVNIVGIGILREMGILITAIIVAGRSGSAFTAQIGTMNVNEEIDAMRTIGLDPVAILVLPRVLALTLVMPLLTFYSDIMGIVGGAVQATVSLDISFVQFIRQLKTAVSITSFWVGVTKAPLFGFIIALVGCFEGFMVTRSAESVGMHTTKAVVEGVFLVIVFDAFLSIFYSSIGW